jgi:hypothetical protein
MYNAEFGDFPAWHEGCLGKDSLTLYAGSAGDFAPDTLTTWEQYQLKVQILGRRHTSGWAAGPDWVEEFCVADLPDEGTCDGLFPGVIEVPSVDYTSCATPGCDATPDGLPEDGRQIDLDVGGTGHRLTADIYGLTAHGTTAERLTRCGSAWYTSPPPPPTPPPTPPAPPPLPPAPYPPIPDYVHGTTMCNVCMMHRNLVAREARDLEKFNSCQEWSPTMGDFDTWVRPDCIDDRWARLDAWRSTRARVVQYGTYIRTLSAQTGGKCSDYDPSALCCNPDDPGFGLRCN